MSDVTRILDSVQQGDHKAAEELLPLVYDELRRLAARYMANERPGQTLQATVLVHDAYFRLIGKADPGWQGRRHFFGAASIAMRRILVENARRKIRPIHGGHLQRVDIENMDIPSPLRDDVLLALDEALNQYVKIDPRGAELVNLCYFGGLTHEQAAKALGVSISTVERDLTAALAWLFLEIQKGQNPPA